MINKLYRYSITIIILISFSIIVISFELPLYNKGSNQTFLSKNYDFSDRTRCGREKIFFLFQQKSGSSTIRENILKPLSNMFPGNSSYILSKDLTECHSTEDEYMITTDRAPWCKGRPDIPFLTIFRHPVERMLSAHEFCLRVPKDSLCRTGQQQLNDVCEFAKRWGNYQFEQFMFVPDSILMEFKAYAKRFCPQCSDIQIMHASEHWNSNYRLRSYRLSDTSTPAGRYHLNRVIDSLNESLAVVGILEEYNSSMELMYAYTGCEQFLQSEIQNVVNQGNDHAKVIAQLKSCPIPVEKMLDADLEIYDAAVNIFHDQRRKLQRLVADGFIKYPEFYNSTRDLDISFELDSFVDSKYSDDYFLMSVSSLNPSASCMRFAFVGSNMHHGLGHRIVDIALMMEFAERFNAVPLISPDHWTYGGEHGSYNWFPAFSAFPNFATRQDIDRIVTGLQTIPIHSWDNESIAQYASHCNVVFETCDHCCSMQDDHSQWCMTQHMPLALSRLASVMRPLFKQTAWGSQLQSSSHTVHAALAGESEYCMVIVVSVRVGDISLGCGENELQNIHLVHVVEDLLQVLGSPDASIITSLPCVEVQYLSSDSIDADCLRMLDDRHQLLPSLISEFSLQRILVKNIIEPSVIKSLWYMIQADILIGSGSSFPYVASIISDHPVFLAPIPKGAAYNFMTLQDEIRYLGRNNFTKPDVGGGDHPITPSELRSLIYGRVSKYATTKDEV